MLVADVAERGGDTIKERLDADEAMVRQHIGAVGKMFARAEPDLEMERPILAKQRCCGQLAFFGNFEMRQQAVDQILLPLAELMPARAPVQAVEGQRIAGLERGHQASA